MLESLGGASHGVGRVDKGGSDLDLSHFEVNLRGFRYTSRRVPLGRMRSSFVGFYIRRRDREARPSKPLARRIRDLGSVLPQDMDQLLVRHAVDLREAPQDTSIRRPDRSFLVLRECRSAEGNTELLQHPGNLLATAARPQDRQPFAKFRQLRIP